MAIGHQLMEAHLKSKASVTRLFIFNNREEIAPNATRVMDAQAKAGINVRLFFSEEFKQFPWPAEVSRDFTIIDNGEAIGITLSFGSNNLVAEWYVQNHNRKQQFEGFRRMLVQASEALSTFHDGRTKQKAKGT